MVAVGPPRRLHSEEGQGPGKGASAPCPCSCALPGTQVATQTQTQGAGKCGVGSNNAPRDLGARGVLVSPVQVVWTPSGCVGAQAPGWSSLPVRTKGSGSVQ